MAAAREEQAPSQIAVLNSLALEKRAVVFTTYFPSYCAPFRAVRFKADMPRGPLVLAAVGVLLALTAPQVINKIKENSEPSRFDKAFEVLAPNLWRQGYHWANLGGLVGVDVYTFLIKADGKYILIDAGAPTSDAAEVLLKGLDDVMNGSKLQLIMLTHGHPDHSGALAALVKAYPGAQVVFHEEEAPYLLGGAPHVKLPAACRYACAPLVQAWLHG